MYLCTRFTKLRVDLISKWDESSLNGWEIDNFVEQQNNRIVALLSQDSKR
jgi:hypothetical protein